MIEKMMMTTNTIKPQYIPFKCPNCNGYKTVSYGKRVCPTCSGDGYLKVPPVDDDYEKDNR